MGSEKGGWGLRSPLDNLRWYHANNPGPAVPNGFGDEAGIQAVWAADSANVGTSK